jgi:hypothetical protein
MLTANLPKITPKSLPLSVQRCAELLNWEGFLARNGDAEPGLKTLWWGIGVLHHLLEGAQLAANKT